MQRIVSVLAIVFFFCSQLFAGQETYSTRVEGSEIAVGATHDVYDIQYFDMLSDPLWASNYTNHHVKNKVQLGINPEVLQNGMYTAEVEVRVTYQEWTISGFSTVVSDRVLTVTYDGNDEFALIDDLSTFSFEGGHYVEVEILTISSGIDVEAIFIESSIDVERYYSFDGNQVEGSYYDFVGINGDYIEFNWDVKEGAEFYELEWVHINDYTIDNGVYVALGDLEYDFYLNSTRISTHDNWYKIPAIFDHGYVIFRVRAVGMQGFDFANRYDGEWNGFEKGVVANFPDGNLASFPNARIIVIDSEYDSKMNWAHQVGYTEEGKRFEGVSFMDGLGRGRQSVSRNTVTEQAVVSNVYYDELGRPAISDLPTPVDGEQLMHYPSFNRPELDPSIGYQPGYYVQNVLNDPECSQTSAGFSLDYGAGKYYSENNLDIDGENAHIPNAEKFPFSRVTYLEDFTNRPRRIGAFGDDLKMGSGHETEMIYVSPNQGELNKLFGSEVGYYEHYQKMITIDANGQAYAQYTDMAGRVVASYMIGPAPSNLDALTGISQEVTTVDLLVDGDSQTTSNLPPSTMLTHYEYFPEDDVYTFNYGFTPSEYEGACLPQNICLDCVYDLTINITDECGAEAFDKTIQVNGTTFDAICNNEPAPPSEDVIPLNVPVTLTAGRYSITKSLSVNQGAINEYWCTYIDNSTCLTPLSDHFNGFYLDEPFDNCQDELLGDDVVGCDIYREMMLEDVSPGGQYALYDETGTGYQVNDQASQDIFLANWQSGTYLNEDGSPYAITNLDDFIDNFRDEWAEQLLLYHPEICYLDFCELSAASDTYVQGMLDTDDYSIALDDFDYFNPLQSPLAQSGFPMGILNGDGILVNEDPFFTSGTGSGFVTQMGSSMSSYANIPYDNGVVSGTVSVDIWEYAILQALDCGPFTSDVAIQTCIYTFRKEICEIDLVWINFREAYLGLRASIYNQAQEAYVADPANNCESNDCIGSIEVGCEIYADKVSRFGNANAQIGTTGYSLTGLMNSTNASNFMNQQVAAGCQQYATQAAAEWMVLLSGCDFANTIGSAAKLNLEADMIALISSGCDQNNPQGSSTSLTGIIEQNTNTTIYSLQELLAAYGLTESNLCSDLLISTPGVYQTAQEAMSDLEKPLDDCACDQVMEASLLATQLNITEEEALMQLTGLDLADVDYIICACEEASTDWVPGYTWSTTELDTLIASDITIPAQLSCDECTVNCSDISTDMSALDTRFGITNFSSVQNYETILTNYLNQQYDYSLAYEDYARFIGQCGASQSDPYCEINPLLTEWAEVMTLVAFRGQLLNDQASQVDLLTENIVYENSGLNGYYSGNNYWSTQSGTILSIHLGTTGDDCTIDLDLTTAIDFEDIVGFGVAIPLTSSCTGNNTFQIEVNYIDCGEIQTKLIDGTSNCFDAVKCICDTTGLRLCNDIEQIYSGPCYQPRLDELYENALEAFQQGVSDEYSVFTIEYNEQCAEAFNTESFNYTGNFRQYQYTLFYYDQAGNLIQTVATEGVDELSASQNVAINAARDAVVNSTNPLNPTVVIPSHDYKTTYEYNSYNQLNLTTNPDQDGDTKFWYDHYGRVVASQNPVQLSENKYSYSFYDPQGRPTQVGQVVQSTLLEESIVKVNDFGTTFTNWVTAGTLSEVTLTQYDRPLGPLVEAMFATGEQENLRLRVASVVYFPSVNGNLFINYESATHYSYDIHGNVKEQIQDVPQLTVVEQNLKSTQYEYELISGNVEKVMYQKDELDQFTHEYEYDDLNRLTEVFTSSDKVHNSREAHYYYYDYGPLARTEIGQYKVQGQDYAYTINGWLKAMNGSTLGKTRDIGGDGNIGYLSDNTSVHSQVAIDINAYTIGYFDGDYSPIGTSSMEISSVSTDFFRTQSDDLYNGNIRHLVTSIHEMGTLGTVYSYDQLQRLTEMRAFENTNTDNSWTGVNSIADYYNAYTYDKNGNILTLQRNGTASSSSLHMDDFVYEYDFIAGESSNRLSYVKEFGTDDGTSQEGDIKGGMANGNFQYDKLGQLIADPSEEILSIDWRSGDKKMSILKRLNTSLLPDLEFKYNPFGIRILKIEKTKSSPGFYAPQEDWNYTYYAHDANGQTMAVYDLEISGTNNQARIAEHHLYGASRLGMIKEGDLIFDNGQIAAVTSDVYQNKLGDRRYELTNHLGNVQAVITDRKTWNGTDINYEAVVVMTSDYYPFGMQMPGRHTENESYRYAYNGMEVDNEVSGNGNSYTTEFRQYDPRLGRWKSLDPKRTPWESPYVGMGNNPIMYNDVLGDTVRSEFTNALNKLGLKWVMATGVGKKFIGKYAAKGDVIAGHTFESDGEYHEINVTFKDQKLDSGSLGKTDDGTRSGWEKQSNHPGYGGGVFDKKLRISVVLPTNLPTREPAHNDYNNALTDDNVTAGEIDLYKRRVIAEKAWSIIHEMFYHVKSQTDDFLKDGIQNQNGSMGDDDHAFVEDSRDNGDVIYRKMDEGGIKAIIVNVNAANLYLYDGFYAFMAIGKWLGIEYTNDQLMNRFEDKPRDDERDEDD